ncbi:DUF2069 domain-containing protein [Thiosocius teredinicola]|uniref:DUF2069 domain-containing protein n=1 Tax=Thiosocius teredinicola TaxID=1973002 RepID=UPI0009914BCE
MKTQLVRWLSLLTYVGLIAWVMAWIIFLGEVDPQHKSIWLLLFVTPLLIPLRGVLAARDKTLVWAVLVTLLYALHGSMVAWTDETQRWLGLTEAALSLGFLFSASYFIRWRAAARVQ